MPRLLYQNGRKNNLVCFGLKISPSLSTWMISQGVSSVDLCLNDDADSESNNGFLGSLHSLARLLEIWPRDNIRILPPVSGDFGQMTDPRDWEDFHHRETDPAYRETMRRRIRSFVWSNRNLFSKTEIKRFASYLNNDEI